MFFRMIFPSSGVMHRWRTPDMLRLYSSALITLKALEHRVIRWASTWFSGSSLFIRYAKYGCIQGTSIIKTSSGAMVFSDTGKGGSQADAAPEPFFNLAPERTFGSSSSDGFLILMERSLISSQKTPAGMLRHWDPMLARVSASSLLAWAI